MSKSIFSKQHEGDPNIKRNTFDLSFANSLTMEMGKLYPVFCKEVLPGDTFRIDTAFGLRFMPMAFPVQTKMRANLQFFYVRNRNLWNKWQQFITKTGQPDEFPYVESKFYTKTNGIGDFFGLPTEVVGLQASPFSTLPFFYASSGAVIKTANYSVCGAFSDGAVVGQTFIQNSNSSSSTCQTAAHASIQAYSDCRYNNIWFNRSRLPLTKFVSGTELVLSVNVLFKSDQESNVVPEDFVGCLLYSTGPDSYEQLPLSTCVSVNPLFNELGSSKVALAFIFKILNDFTLPENSTLGFCLAMANKGQVLSFYLESIDNNALGNKFVSNLSSFMTGSDAVAQPLTVTGRFVNIEAVGFSVRQPYYVGDVSSYAKYKVSALPFRAYESIYNAFYRDDRNNPYVVNGVSDPNVYLPTKDGGLDNNTYELHRVNWEQDFLTTAVPSPQQGPAPLVGITSSGKATFMDSDGNEYNAQFNVGEDGDTVTSVDFPDANIPSSARQTAIALATEGISINDFRNVNALQRWLETNMRKGYKYKDQIASHFGVNISYAELDMPEFIGGVSQLADIAQINQTSASTDIDPLGSYAGQASVVGGNNHTISTYCDEHGFIIGLFYVVPTPTYSQLLPKHFLKFDPMDYFFPEFGHLGYQPIKYDEVCPLQASYQNVPLTDTYGYQRAWYDYLQSVDEVHGDFRTTLQSFILSRVFKSVPSLNPDFLTVSQDQLNEIFTVTEVNGEPIRPILGQLYFDVLAKRKIPRYGVPRLE